jgi:hypothetical protein
MNSMQQLLDFASRLKEAKIQYILGCERDAIMVSIVSPSIYYEVEFFADGDIGVPTWGPAGTVKVTTLPEITDTIVKALHGDPDEDGRRH